MDCNHYSSDSLLGQLSLKKQEKMKILYLQVITFYYGVLLYS